MQRPVSEQNRNENVMNQKASDELLHFKRPLEKFRLLCLQRGAKGIMEVGRIFRRMDSNYSGDLSKAEFMEGIRDSGLDITEEEAENLFLVFDSDRSGKIKYEEFLGATRPAMSKGRLALVEKAFKKLDRTGEGKISFADLTKVYSAKMHADYLNGQKSEKELLQIFVKNFEEGGIVDGCVTKDEFLDYYSGVSASIDEDGYFDLMMRTAWKL